MKNYIEHYYKDISYLTWDSIDDLVDKLRAYQEEYMEDPESLCFPILDIEFTRDRDGDVYISLNKKRLETEEEYNKRVESSRRTKELYQKMIEKEEYEKYLKLKEKYEKSPTEG